MHWIFKPRDKLASAPLVRIERIEVDPAIVDSEFDYALPHYVGDVISLALEDHWYLGTELPEGAWAFGDAWKYDGEIVSNGHSVLGGNWGGDEAAWGRAAGFFEELGLIAISANLREFIEFEREYAEILADHPGDEYDFEIHSKPYARFDDVYYAEAKKADINACFRNWLLSREWIDVVEGAADLYRDRGVVIPPHPLAQRRREQYRAAVGPDLDSARKLFWNKILNR